MTAVTRTIERARIRGAPERRAIKYRFNSMAIVGALLVSLFLIIGILAPMPYSPLAQDITHARETPSLTHHFGTDELGRDILSRIVAGIRITLRISLSTLIFSSFVGISIGLISGFFGGKVDSLLMRTIEIQLAIPSMILALVLVSLLKASLNSLVLVMAMTSYPSFARLVRGLTLQVSKQGYVEASVAIGARQSRIITRHILPNILPHILVLATLSLGRVVLHSASLGFLGFGGEPGTPELGMMLASARTQFFSFPHMVIFPGLAIFLLVLGFNLLGDGVRDVMDPRLRGK